MKKVIISIMLLAGVYGISFSQQGSKPEVRSQGTNSQEEGYSSISKDSRWEKIGEKTVDLSTDNGVIDWKTDRERSVNANNVYSEIKFRCTDVPVELKNVEVVYDDGHKQNLTTDETLKVNSESKSLILDSIAKLDRITFSFNKNAAAERYKAKIEVWGLKANSGSGMGQSSSDQKD